jgi:lipopolysaccharide export system permease protein
LFDFIFKQNTLIAKYIRNHIWGFFFAVFLIINLIVFGNQVVLVIKESLHANIAIADILPIVGLKVIRDIPLILSLSLFLAIILAISKLYKNTEAVVMNAVGIGEARFAMFCLPTVFLVFFLTLFLTLFATPWAESQRANIISKNKNASEFSFIHQGEFQKFKGGDIVFYASEVSAKNKKNTQQMKEVFIWTIINNEPIVTFAKQAQRYTNTQTGGTYLRLKDGHRYHGFFENLGKKILKFDTYDLQISAGDNAQKYEQKNPQIKLRTTRNLLDSTILQEISELQWRFAQPLSILVLSFLGVLLGKSHPRGGKNLGVLAGVVIFILYNNGLLMAKAALEKGTLAPELGLWSVHFVAILFVWVFYLHRVGKINLFSIFKRNYVKPTQ